MRSQGPRRPAQGQGTSRAAYPPPRDPTLGPTGRNQTSVSNTALILALMGTGSEGEVGLPSKHPLLVCWESSFPCSRVHQTLWIQALLSSIKLTSPYLRPLAVSTKPSTPCPWPRDPSGTWLRLPASQNPGTDSTPASSTPRRCAPQPPVRSARDSTSCGNTCCFWLAG